MGTPHTIDICVNCGEPVIWYNNTGAWKHYPEHPLNAPATDCLAPHVKAADRTTTSLAANKKTAVRKSA